ncbi:MAG TPA: RNA polymerase sigma factor [Anaerolineaceae bacterium]|nr:RNA polymerase sigma factor [Anaerolineaceae bacterium]
MEPSSDPKGNVDPPELIAGLVQGQAQAWQQLCELYGEPLYLYALHRCDGDPHAAEDVRQETLLAAVRAIDHYRAEVPLFGWLCGIARHKAADWRRLSARETRLDDDREPTCNGYAQNEAAAWPLSSVAPAPGLIVENGETRAAVVEALWSLPADHRQALIHRYLRGESVETVSAFLNRSYKATESILSRARQAIRKRIVEYTEHVDK